MFEAGKSGNPRGRPKGSYGGRIKALAALDQILARKKSQKALMRALEAELQADPVRFFRGIVMPLLPRESRLEFDRDSVIQWKSLLGVGERVIEGEASPALSVGSDEADGADG